MPFEAWQCDSGPAVARVYCMRVDLAGVLPVYAVDSYVGGRGRMRGRLLGLVPVADGSGSGFDVSELPTWVAEVAMTAPSMLLVPATRRTPVVDGCVELAFTDRGTTVTVRLSIHPAGRLVDVVTEDRFAALPQGPTRARWTTPVTGWTTVEGRGLPVDASAVWHLPKGSTAPGRRGSTYGHCGGTSRPAEPARGAEGPARAGRRPAVRGLGVLRVSSRQRTPQ